MRLFFSVVACMICLPAACTGEPSPAPAAPPSQPAGCCAAAPRRDHPGRAGSRSRRRSRATRASGSPPPTCRASARWANPRNPMWQNGVVPAARGGRGDLRQGVLPRRPAQPDAGPTRASTTGSPRHRGVRRDLRLHVARRPRPGRARGARGARAEPAHARHRRGREGAGPEPAEPGALPRPRPSPRTTARTTGARRSG